MIVTAAELTFGEDVVEDRDNTDNTNHSFIFASFHSQIMSIYFIGRVTVRMSF
jgi:hypothetical protein